MTGGTLTIATTIWVVFNLLYLQPNQTNNDDIDTQQYELLHVVLFAEQQQMLDLRQLQIAAIRQNNNKHDKKIVI